MPLMRKKVTAKRGSWAVNRVDRDAPLLKHGRLKHRCKAEWIRHPQLMQTFKVRTGGISLTNVQFFLSNHQKLRA